ncbi:aryl-sulfate sulfotransferase [Acidicapsa acidisoli]|uniref:aryl-sulfate sulfotransferase n=1 Tax=Acidicapsa acidisoli TaxID=1615681 RepID=UPI0021DF73C7|nr:aryl-sulfate sulfotransferase [Acidicapsa acidisoli]
MPEQIAKMSNWGPSVADGIYPQRDPLKHQFGMTTRLIFLCAGLSAASLVGCGGGSKGDFTLEVAPATITVVPGGPAQTFTVGASPVNGFKGSVALTVGSLPTGVTASPTSLTITPGTLMQVSVTASSTAVAGSASIALSGTSGTLTHSASSSLTVAPLPPPVVADFALEVAPSTITLVPGGAAQTLTVGASPINGFTGSVALAVGSLPAGVTATPTTSTITPGMLMLVSVTASSTAAVGTTNIALNGTSGALSHSGFSTLTVTPPPAPVTTAALSTASFSFGNNLVNNSLTQTVVLVTNTGSDTLMMSPTLSGDPSYSIVSSQSCGSQLAAAASCDVVVKYTPTTPSAPKTQDAVLNMGFGDVPAGTPQTVAITGISAALTAGQVTATNNPQVALYTMTLPFPGSMTVNFGTTTAYGFTTWSQSTDTAGGKVSILVAGMKAVTAYHMQAVVTLSNGVTASDADHSVTTGAVPANMVISLTAGAMPGMTPQPGLEMLNPLSGTPTGVIVTDLSGNVLWTYANPGSGANFIDGVKMLPDGDLLMTIGASSGAPLSGPIPDGTFLEMREVDLAGNTVREISIADLNAELATATCAECGVVIDTFHHDVEPLPNGHWLVLGNTIRQLSSTSKPPLTNAAPQSVLGDVIVDLDQNLQPVWVWNEFNHLDPNRHPLQFPDWTHTNAIVYSPDDGNILVSMRHQNWVVKVDYANGTGKGDILWHLGEGGDFTLQGGTDPTDWEYAQHGPGFFSPNTSGVFSLGLMDNGDDRIFPSTVKCGSAGAPPCLYTTIPVFQIDETAKTANLTFHQILPSTLYSFFGGNTDQLQNGNVEYDLCGLGTRHGSDVYEVTQESTPQTVWSMHVTGTNLYRAFRIPSFYPGVQW